MSEAAAATYRQRAGAHEAARAACARTSDRLIQARLALFLGALGAGLAAERTGSGWLWAGAALLAAAFLALVGWHRRIRARMAELQELAALNREGIARVARDWERLPTRPGPADAALHPYAGDLDLFGPASLTQLLGPHGSAPGAAVLDGWLLQPPDAGDLAERQEAVRELATLADWRERLALHARRTRGVSRADLETFLAWAETPAPAGGAALTVLPFVLPLLIWVPLLLDLWVPIPPLWWLGVLATLAAAGTSARAAHRELARAFGREALIDHFPALLGTIAAQEFASAPLRRLHARVLAGGSPAPVQIARLRRLMNFADARFSSVHFLLQLAFLWDLHVLRALLRWKRECGASVRDWLAAAAELEALAVLGTLAHDEPEWCFPTVDAAAAAFEARVLGHPLIAGAQRVSNDVRIGPAGTFLLVTGSNMSGKSTLLRAVGLNTVLARTGAPCCAAALRLPPVALGSSIRVQDSLARGVSYFMAELERLKLVVDAAEAHAGAFLFLLDEILHGTNTAERRIAARQVIAHLVATGAIGAVTTHDLDLAVSEDLQQNAVPVHFTEQFVPDDAGVERMTFDYVLRPGLAPSTNALKLMELVGLKTMGRATD